MLTIGQRDPRWSEIKLGDSVCTVGRYGCLITDISMALYYYKKYISPGILARILDFTPGGLLLWDSLSTVGLKLTKRGYGRNDSDIQSALKNPATVCILQVQGNHWVLATGNRLLGGYNIADSWFGDRSTTGRYGNNITGYAVISKQ
jgi:hypothetical protein